MFTKMMHNPGYAGSSESPEATVAYRQQWMGFEGAPGTQLVTYNQPWLNNRVGFGGSLIRNSIGINRTLTLEFAYAYRIPMRRGFIAMGVLPSIRQLSQNWNDERLVTTQPRNTDAAIPVEPKSIIVPNAGAGLYYHTVNWYAGIAVPRLFAYNIDFAELGANLSREVQHLNAMGGATLPLAEEIDFTPQVLLRYVPGAPFDADFNLSLMFMDKFYGGASYRLGGETGGLGESFGVMLGLQAYERKLFFCLSYDIGLTALRRYNNGSIEAVVRYWFNPPEGDPDRIQSPTILPN
jgi:type IX secretion system PorP/SprF family membrane protein